MEKYYLGIDVGGSHLSMALVGERSGKILEDKVHEVKVDSNATAVAITGIWQAAIQKELSRIKPDVLGGIGVAIPGPFEYERGFSKIAGVPKFKALFGVNVRQIIRAVLNGDDKPVTFINDATAFALGEYSSEAVRSSRRTLFLSLGTGLGSAFLLDGVPQISGEGIPSQGYLYNVPFKDSMAEDYFSTRWFLKTWEATDRDKTEGVKELAVLARNADADALRVFRIFSDNLSAFLEEWIGRFNPDTVILGGNIAKAADLFLVPLQEIWRKRGVKIKTAELAECAPLIGAAMFASLNAGPEKVIRRNTQQYLIPGKKNLTASGKYDIYPGFPLGKGKIQEGTEKLASWIGKYKTVVIDGYVGVAWDILIENLDREFRKQGKRAVWFQVDAALLEEEEIDEMLKPWLGGDDPVFGKITDKHLSDWFDPEKMKLLKPDPGADINILIGCGAALARWDGPLVYVDLPKNELQFRMRAGSATNLGIKRQQDAKQTYKRFYFVDWVVLNEHKCQLLPRIDLIVDEQRPDCCLFMSGQELREGLKKMSSNFFRVRPWFEPGIWGGNWMKEHIPGLNREVGNLAWSFELMVLENGLLFESDSYLLEVSFDFLMYEGYKAVLGDCAERFQYEFPIRFDFLDTFDGGNLSVQCHPRTPYIQQQFGMKFTQDETYYILDCKDQAAVYLGFQEGIDPEEFRMALLDSQKNAKVLDIERFVQKHQAHKHDLYLIPNGTVHGSGKNNMVLEISSAPYIFTFKLYDWVRLDADGKPRPINIEHGMNNLVFERQGKLVQEELISRSYILEETEDYVLEHLPTHKEHFYDVHRYTFRKEIGVKTEGKCHVCMLVEGENVTVYTQNGMQADFHYAETFVIPAAAGSYRIVNRGKEPVTLVKAFVK